MFKSIPLVVLALFFSREAIAATKPEKPTVSAPTGAERQAALQAAESAERAVLAVRDAQLKGFGKHNSAEIHRAFNNAFPLLANSSRKSCGESAPSPASLLPNRLKTK